MFNIFSNEAHKENRAKDKHTLLIMVLAILEENTHHLLVLEALFWLF